MTSLVSLLWPVAPNALPSDLPWGDFSLCARLCWLRSTFGLAAEPKRLGLGQGSGHPWDLPGVDLSRAQPTAPSATQVC